MDALRQFIVPKDKMRLTYGRSAAGLILRLNGSAIGILDHAPWLPGRVASIAFDNIRTSLQALNLDERVRLTAKYGGVWDKGGNALVWDEGGSALVSDKDSSALDADDI